MVRERVRGRGVGALDAVLFCIALHGWIGLLYPSEWVHWSIKLFYEMHSGTGRERGRGEERVREGERGRGTVEQRESGREGERERGRERN